jgi:hypothetical protein
VHLTTAIKKTSCLPAQQTIQLSNRDQLQQQTRSNNWITAEAGPLRHPYVCSMGFTGTSGVGYKRNATAEMLGARAKRLLLTSLHTTLVAEYAGLANCTVFMARHLLLASNDAGPMQMLTN